MKKFYNLLTITVLIAFGSNLLWSSNDEPLPKKLIQYDQPKCIGLIGTYDNPTIKVSKNRILGQKLNWLIMDTLANSLSYHSRSTTPFVYNDKHGILGTIKRGAKNPDEQGVDRTNTKNNLFVRLSTDLGRTWSAPDVIYDEFQSKYGGGRYPTMNFFEYDEELHVAWSASLVNEAAGEWKGYVTGISSQSIGTAHQLSDSCRIPGKSYGWGVSDASVAGYQKGGEFVIYAMNGVLPQGGSLTDNGNIGYRYTVDLLPVKTGIPDQWKSSVFNPVDTVASVPKELIGIRFRKNGDWYFGVNGNFVTNPNVQAAKVGFSISKDKGTTWEPFIVNPPNLFKDYGASLGLNPDKCGIGYHSKDFTVMENGDVWFAVLFYEFDDNKAYADRVFQVLAVHYQASNGNWTIHKLADVTGLWLNLLDDKQQSVGSASDLEIEVSKTADERYLVFKWLDLVGVTWVAADQYQFRGNDMFMKIYDAQNKNWGSTVNVTDILNTEGALMMRDTHMPEELPNDLSLVPMLSLHTILDPSESYITGFRSYLRKQWILVTTVDASKYTTVEETNYANEFVNVFPNPVQDEAILNINGNGSDYTITLVDALGRTIQTIYNGKLDDGMHSIRINTNNYQSGTYYLQILNNNKIKTKVLNVIK